MMTNTEYSEVQVTEQEKILEALRSINQSNYWKVLNDLLFKVEEEKIRKQLATEIEPLKLYRLQGQLSESEKFTNLGKLIEKRQMELLALRKNNGKTKNA